MENEIKLSGRFKGATNRMMTGRRIYSVEFTSGDEELDFFLDEHKDQLLHFDIRTGTRERKRSLSANAYAWQLIGEIARKAKLTKEEVYRQEIQELGNGHVMQLKPEAVPEFERNWKKNGLGWFVERIGSCMVVDRNGEAHEEEEVLAIYGSSAFSTGEMSTFIDAIIKDCHELKIPVEPIDYIEELIDMWQ